MANSESTRRVDATTVFPWGSNSPTRGQRVVVAFGAAAFGVGWLVFHSYRTPNWRTDFAMVWFGARSLLSGDNPYELVGPGLMFDWSWPLLYPGTALVVGIPFAWLSEQAASVVFVAASCFLMTYGMTKHSWHLLPIFASEPFAQSARAAQWSILFVAALYLPWLCFLVAAKPQSGLPIAAATSGRGLAWAAGGGIALLGFSLVLLPEWPVEWLRLVREAEHMKPRIAGPGGFLLLLLLRRWRRPEAWMILTLACLPQTLAAYNLLLLLTVAGTFREAAALAIISTMGALVDPYLLGSVQTREGVYQWLLVSELVMGYFPAAFLVLRRPNTGEPPAWLRAALAVFARSRRLPKRAQADT